MDRVTCAADEQARPPPWLPPLRLQELVAPVRLRHEGTPRSVVARHELELGVGVATLARGRV